MASLPFYTLAEIEKHSTADSLWMVFDGKVYDVTAFKADHPGGEQILLDNAGIDASGVFQDIGHSADAVETREKYLIGVVSSEQPTSTCCGGSCSKIALLVGAVAVIGLVVFAYRKYK